MKAMMKLHKLQSQLLLRVKILFYPFQNPLQNPALAASISQLVPHLQPVVQ